MTPARKNTLAAVNRERNRQEKIHSQTLASLALSPAEKLTLLAEEFGEVAKEVCEQMQGKGDVLLLHAELVQTAACCVAWCESLGLKGGAS